MPSKKSWLDLVSTCEDVYVYQAALLCEGCGEAVITELEETNQEDTGDSDDWPQGPHSDGGGEADSPNHCDSGPKCVNAIQVPGGVAIGYPLGNPLTSDGEKYVFDAVAKDILDKSNHKRAIGRLWHHIYDYVKPDELVRLDPKSSATANLGTLLDSLPAKARVPPEFYTDLDYLYGVTLNPGTVILWRAEITPEGNFANLETVLLPEADFPGRTIEDALDEAWHDGAWD